ncbi:TetR/AcrR family transcriptional regulator [Aminipila sp.]|uniref:TetR/AcrR family transcriptional regulator n=1 Tax=Aminipila sp. TaxID=2060095 RepID=UPI00289CA6E7|nr:TetR/AcrR family transcriptional regulator [Aminipila sp.]
MESKQVQETKRKIKNAYLELYRKKRIEQISIKEITERAELNRGTFYVYFADIYDLRDKIEEEAMEEIRKHALPVIKTLMLNKKLNTEILPKEFFLKEQAILELFFGDRAEAKTVNKLKKIMQEAVMEILGLREGIADSEKVKLNYALEYVSSGQLGLMGYWFKNRMELPMEELGEMMGKINLTGVITYLFNDIKKADG